MGLGPVLMGPENLAPTGVQPRSIQPTVSHYNITDALFFSRKRKFKVNVNKKINVKGPDPQILTKRRLAVYIQM